MIETTVNQERALEIEKEYNGQIQFTIVDGKVTGIRVNPDGHKHAMPFNVRIDSYSVHVTEPASETKYYIEVTKGGITEDAFFESKEDRKRYIQNLEDFDDINVYEVKESMSTSLK